MRKRTITRLAFISRTAAAAATVTILPRHAFAGPNDKLNMACVGVGGRVLLDPGVRRARATETTEQRILSLHPPGVKAPRRKARGRHDAGPVRRRRGPRKRQVGGAVAAPLEDLVGRGPVLGGEQVRWRHPDALLRGSMACGKGG